MGTCTATFTKDTYNLGETIVCNFSWTGGFYCDASGYYARVAILDTYGNEVSAANRQTSSGTNFPLNYLPTQAGTTWTGKITLYQYPNCNPPLCIATDTCTIISPTVTLTLASTPTAGGTIHAHPACCTYNSGDYIAVHALPNSGYHFDYWTDNHGNTVYSSEWNFYITSNTTCTAHFSLATTYTLSLNNAPYAGGYIWNSYNGNNCTVTQCNYTNIPAGTIIDLSAFTKAGWVFNGWTGDIGACNPLSLDCDIIMNQNRTITANYTQIQYCWITMQSQPGGSATCSPTSCLSPSECICGTSVTITATPEYGYEFTGWAGDYTGMTNPATFPLNQDMTVTATFQYLGEPWTVSPINLVFDATPIGECTAKTLTVTNNDVGPMNISLSSNKTAFTFPGGTTFILLPSMALPIPIMFCPETIGEITGAIIIACTAGTCNPASWTIAVTGQGTPSETGACCIGTTCNITTPSACTGTFIGLGTNCTPNPCIGLPTGSAEFTTCPTEINQSIIAYFTWNNAVQPSMDDIAYMYIKRPDGSIAVFWIEDTYGNPTGTKELSIPIDQTGTWTAHIDIANGAGNWITYEDSCILEPGYSLMITIDPTAGGQVNANPDLETYPKDTSVQLTVQASLGYSFDYWTGGLTGKTNPATIIMNSDKTVVAHFKSLAEVTCYGCNIDEVKSDGFPIGTTCSETNTPGYPFSEYPNCSSSNLTKYLVYAGIGLAITGAVVYLVRRKTNTKIEQPPQSQVKKQRKTRR